MQSLIRVLAAVTFGALATVIAQAAEIHRSPVGLLSHLPLSSHPIDATAGSSAGFLSSFSDDSPAAGSGGVSVHDQPSDPQGCHPIQINDRAPP